MANRPVFVTDDQYYVSIIDTEFEWHSGLSKSQRKKSAKSLEDAFLRKHPGSCILEVSSFSDNDLGNSLSAFNLLYTMKDGRRIPVEQVFQAGKKFRNGGPFTDLLEASPKEAKKDPRLSSSGMIVGFELEGQEFMTTPKTLFYSWLYLHALDDNRELADQLMSYNAFTDIVFNPKRSINCQAYVCAVYVTLRKKGELGKALEDISFLSKILSMSSMYFTFRGSETEKNPFQ